MTGTSDRLRFIDDVSEESAAVQAAVRHMIQEMKAERVEEDAQRRRMPPAGRLAPDGGE